MPQSACEVLASTACGPCCGLRRGVGGTRLCEDGQQLWGGALGEKRNLCSEGQGADKRMHAPSACVASSSFQAPPGPHVFHACRPKKAATATRLLCGLFARAQPTVQL
eukprot:358296-Chlamydomonas_euryale.AAC.6